MKRNRPGETGTTRLVPGPYLRLTLGNPTDRPIRPRSIIITGASTGQEVLGNGTSQTSSRHAMAMKIISIRVGCNMNLSRTQP
jgi:hypothetical protein